MRLALLAPLRHPIKEPYAGGLEWHTAAVAGGLAARGVDLTLVAHPDSVAAGKLLPVRVPETVSKWGYARALYGVARRLRRNDFDVVINNSIHFFPDLFRPRNLPMLTVLHTPPYRLHRLVGQWASQRSHPLAISHHLAANWKPYLAAAPTVIHNGVDPELWRLGETPEPQTAVWYGRLTPEKGADIAIRVTRAAGWRLRLAGPIYDDQYFTGTVEPMLGEGVEYLGHLPQEELIAVVRASAVGLVTPRWEEPFGMVYAELMSCGVPVLGFRSGAASEVIPDAQNHLVAMGDEERLTRVLREFVGGNGEVDRRDLRRHIVEHFSLDTMVDAYLRQAERAALGGLTVPGPGKL